MAGLCILLTLPSTCRRRRLARPAPTTRPDQRRQVRVLLLDDAAACTLNFAGPFEVVELDARHPRPARHHFDNPRSPIRIVARPAQITIAGRPFHCSRLSIRPADQTHTFTLNDAEYRGWLVLVRDPNAPTFDAVNYLDLESYLAGVLGAEMPDYWEPEALKAQAIAARTYCLYIQKRFGRAREWDVTKTQAHQVYRGVAAESANVWNAVNQTSAMVLLCKGPDGREDIFPAYYSSMCGGHTENSKNVFGDSYEPLKGVPCPYCAQAARPGAYFWPSAKFDANEVTRRLFQKYPNLRRLGRIVEITPVAQSHYRTFSRLTKVSLRGSTGATDVLRAEDLRLTIDPAGTTIRSTACQIRKSDHNWVFAFGRGYGHGVGLCQWAAQAMARKGKSASQILAYYYPGSRIAKDLPDE